MNEETMVRAWWRGLSPAMRWFVMVAVLVLVLIILGSFVFLGTDYSGFGDFLAGWQ